MDDATCAVMPPDLEMIPVGDAFWQRCGRWELQESSYSRSTIIRWRWLQISVRSSSSRRQLPIHRSVIEFIRGA